MNILILGAQGQIGTHLTKLEWPSHVYIKPFSHEALDITNKEHLEIVVKSQAWDFVINASGFVQVDQAEISQREPYLVNSLGLLHLAALSKKYNIPLFHYSTDYVFDGTKKTPYTETDEFNPLNTYGLSKLFGEFSIQSTWHKHIILRTSWVYGIYGHNFVKTILKKAQDKQDIKVVSDQWGTPTWGQDIAKVTQEIIFTQLIEQDQKKWGVYHYAGAGSTSWYEYAKYIVEVSASPATVVPICSQAQRSLNPGVSERPLYSPLDSTLIQKTFSIPVHPWQEGVKEVIEKLIPSC